MYLSELDPNFTKDQLAELMHKIQTTPNWSIESTHRRKDGTFYLWNLDKKCYLSGLFPTEEPNTWVFDDKVNYYLLTKDDRGTFHIEEIGEKGTYKRNNEETTFKKEG